MIFISQLGISSVSSFSIIHPFQHYDPKEKIVLGVTKLWKSDTQAIKVELIEVLISRCGRGFGCRTIAYLEDIEGSEPYVLGLSSDEGDILKRQFIVALCTRQNLLVLSCDPQQDALACLHSTRFNRSTGDSTDGKKESAARVSRGLLDLPVDTFFRSTEGQMLQYKFELESCIRSIGQNDEESRTILRHLFALASKLRSYIAISSSPLLPDYMIKWCDHVSETNFKWTTFELLRSSYVEGRNTSMTLREQWLLFSQSDVISLLEHYMKKGAMRAVMILWRRHLNDQLVLVISELLQLLPLSLSVSVYENWVKFEVIPAVFRLSERHLSVMQNFARWILERAEIAAKQGDIDTAIRFATILQDASCPTSLNSLTFFQNFNLHASEDGGGSSSFKIGEKEGFDPFQRLKLLTDKLQHIQYLTKTHNFSMTLARFIDESPTSIAKSMLDRVPSSDLLVDEISEHVEKYLSYCGLELDPVLSSYVIELAESLPTSNQETRALIVLESIADVDVRVDTALVVFGSSRSPYSTALKQYAQAAKLLNSNRQEEVEHFVQLMELQDMLISYGIKKFNVGDIRGATRLMNHILGQISRPTAFEDALRLVGAYGRLSSANAASRYIENLLTFPCQTSPGDHRAANEVLSAEVSTRVIRAIDAIHHVKKCEENPMVVLLLAENSAQFGLTLLEMKETHQVDFPCIQRKSVGSDSTITGLNVDKHVSFLLSMILALVELFLAEIQALRDSAVNERHENVLTYIASPNFLLSTHLLRDLQKIKLIETEWGILLSIRTLRDPDRRETRIRLHMKPEVIFASDLLQNGDKNEFKGKVNVNRGAAGKKRTAQPYNEHELQNPPLKTYRNTCTGGATVFTRVPTRSTELQQGDEEAQSLANLSRFASSLGITPSTYHSLIAQCAADNGLILRAVRFSRDLFSRRRERTRQTQAFNNTKRPTSINGIPRTFEFASRLKNISLSISRYTAMDIDNVYDFSKITQTRQPAAEFARLRAPLYSMELLRYSICVCDMDSFEETFLLLKNATLLNEVLRFTELDVTRNKSDYDLLNWQLYSHFYRGDPCVLPCAQTMRLASRFVIAEHRKLIDRADLDDLTPSRRYISFLVDNSATLLSLQILLSMRIIPEDAYGVIQVQLGKLLSTVFQSHCIDNQLALG